MTEYLKSPKNEKKYKPEVFHQGWSVRSEAAFKQLAAMNWFRFVRACGTLCLDVKREPAAKQNATQYVSLFP